MPPPPVVLTVEQDALRAVARVLKDEADGKELRKELTRTLRATANRPIEQAKSSILAGPSKGLTQGQSLRSTVASSIKPVVRLSGNQTGVSIRQTRTPGLRGFRLAGRKFNRPQFRHPVYGGSAWVVQQGNPEWFDKPMQAARPEAKKDVMRAVQNLSIVIEQRVRARS
jgi:hypothetical protein